MERLPVELLYLLAFGAIIFFNYLMRGARRRQQEDEAQRAPEQPPAQAEPLEEIWGRAQAAVEPPPTRAPRPPAPPLVRTPAPAPRRRHPVRDLLRDKRDLRRAAILITVLGPCRAEEPPARR